MIDTQEIEILRRAESRISEVDFDNLPFGRVFADHMLVAEYKNGAWQKAVIKPFEDFKLSPAISAIHYGQSIFEGMKAFKGDDSMVRVFRPEKNWARFNESAKRLCMPQVPRDIFIEGIRQLVDLDRNWVPNNPSASLYIRPYMFATDPFLGVKPSESYIFAIITSPVGPYYAKPLHLKIETHYTRAAMGGVGFAKAAGNYAGAMYPAKLAQEQGIDQLIWTDAKEHKYMEEAGTMNMMVVIDNKLITPPLTTTILDGITRDSFLVLAREAGIEVEERRVMISEVMDAIHQNKLQELFGVGTAATIAHVEKLTWEDECHTLPPVSERKISVEIGRLLLAIKKGQTDDIHGWNMTF